MTSLHEVQADPAGWRFSTHDLQRYRDDGVVLVRGLLADDVRETVADDLERLVGGMEQQLGVAADWTHTTGQQRVQQLSRRLLGLMQQDASMQSVVYDAMSRMPSLHATAASPSALGPIRQLLSDDVAIHERLILLMSPPEDQWHLPLWHQDWFYNEGPAETLTLYVPLQRTTGDNGSLLMAPGEHRRGVLPHDDHDHGHRTKWRTLDPKVVSTFANVVDTELDPGDALLFNSLVPHSARLNRSDDFRFVINLRYRDLRDPAFRRDQWRIGRIDRAREALSRSAPVVAAPHIAFQIQTDAVS